MSSNVNREASPDTRSSPISTLQLEYKAYDEEFPEACLGLFFANQRKVGRKWKELGIPAPTEVSKDAEGNLKPQHHQVPPPRSQKPHKDDDPCAGEIVPGKAVPEAKEREFIVVATHRVRELQEQGWTLWDAPTPALDIDKGYKDDRVFYRWFDVNTTDNPVADTAFFLGRASDFPLLGDGGSDPEVQAKSPSFAPFTPVEDMTETRSATSTGHIHQRRRPIGIGPGWGSYDDFTIFQSYERKWSIDTMAPFEVRSKSGQIMRCDVKLEPSPTTLPPPPDKQSPAPSLKEAQDNTTKTAAQPLS
ncbi:hypothetical protein GGS23DRAFT_605738 [Durotheca rogersii]|uniref:uncharacterized protein n=1 Tax=Durotheca rogersii TaxID=419775 RepID=UPI00221FC77B|nr:uncharacterized protein GGS23DRAFT_605738 [Durotheca rogersii]KAI5862474.1 hypothetical protein GGS23DRAFT_605738 [Durotheca rogersii]